MSKDWTPDELQAASKVMKEAGHLSYDEFCEELDRDGFDQTIREDGGGEKKNE